MDPRHHVVLVRLHAAADAVVLAELRAALATDATLARVLCSLLWQRHERALQAFVRRRGRDVADDALSDLQLRFVRWCYGESPLTAPTLRPIAFTIAERASKDAIRRKGPATTQVDHEVIATEDDVLERLASDSAVAALLAGLGARDRRIIEARLADVPDDELAAELAIEPNALYVARFRALARVRSLIETTP